MSKRKKTEPVSNTQAGANCRAMLAQLTVAGKVDRQRFVAEMQRRSMELHGKPLKDAQLRLLARIVATYEQEQAI